MANPISNFFKAKSMEYCRKAFENEDHEARNSLAGDETNFPLSDSESGVTCREICEYARFSASDSSIDKMIATVAQEKLLRSNGFDVERLNKNHLAKLLSVEEEREKLMLARRIADNSISGKELQRIIPAKKVKDSSSEVIEKSNIIEYPAEMRLIIRGKKFRNFRFDQGSIKSLDSKSKSELKNEAKAALKRLQQLQKAFRELIREIDADGKDISSKAA